MILMKGTTQIVMSIWTTLLIGLLIVVVCGTIAASSSSPSPPSTQQQHPIVLGVDGGTESIRACFFDAQTGHVVGKACASPYPTFHPKPGWAEQDPKLWWECLGNAVQRALETLPAQNRQRDNICAMAIDTTCCSVVALDKSNEPIGNCLLWMDQRSATQAQKIMEWAKGDPALLVNCNGQDPVSAEWMTPKALWMYENWPRLWKKKIHTICEYQDYINYKLTGNLCASSCNAASRWHWDGEACLDDGVAHDSSNQDPHQSSYPGRPMSLYEKLGIPDLADKLPSKCLAMGSRVGDLTQEAADHLGLPKGLPVIQGGPDAFVGIIGLGCINPGQLCLITGSSHLHCAVTDRATTAQGIWGAYKGAPLPGLNLAEGGQSSTGSIARWAKKLFGGTEDEFDNGLTYRMLDNEAGRIEPGADGLVALETFQGSRTPATDPLACGALLGLTLSHTRAHVWRALLEAVSFGTRACIEGLEAAGHSCDEIILAGGVTRTDMWLQMHADVTGKTVKVCENSDAPLLGCAILASVGVRIHKSVPDAVGAMVRTSKRIRPNRKTAKKYSSVYEKVYQNLAETTRPIAHSIHELRGGGSTSVTISPSLLACDWANIRQEVNSCLNAGLYRLHVDVFDGVFLDSPHALTFGPQMVKAIRRSCDDFDSSSNRERAILDLHICVEQPSRYVEPMARMGGDCFIFQFEAMKGTDEAIAMAKMIAEYGMECGVSINPETDVEKIYPLLKTEMVHVVDILAVEPGFGGQEFQTVALEKIQNLKQWRDAHGSSFHIMVDGGISDQTAPSVANAGADILVAGTYLFRHAHGLGRAAKSLWQPNV